MKTDLKRVLVVDDDRPLRTILTQMIARLGYEVLATNCGERGLELFLKNRFDIVITDFEMPGMDGIDLAGRIKKKSPHTKIVLTTGQGKASILPKMRDSSVDQLLFKPFGIEEVHHKIQSVLDR